MEGGAQPSDPTEPPKPPPRPGKKTEQQRRKEKEARAQELRRRQDKLLRGRRQQLFRLRSLGRQLRCWEQELLRRRMQREAKRRQMEGLPRRLGRLKYEDPALEVQLSDELAESLRTLKVQEEIPPEVRGEEGVPGSDVVAVDPQPNKTPLCPILASWFAWWGHMGLGGHMGLRRSIAPPTRCGWVGGVWFLADGAWLSPFPFFRAISEWIKHSKSWGGGCVMVQRPAPQHPHSVGGGAVGGLMGQQGGAHPPPFPPPPFHTHTLRQRAASSNLHFIYITRIPPLPNFPSFLTPFPPQPPINI
uniref:Ribosome biogenesis protein NOP53 n=1 Tax=Coturnix japonica TaxID=93934 RepID=A0A8C2SU31_COTJA